MLRTARLDNMRAESLHENVRRVQRLLGVAVAAFVFAHLTIPQVINNSTLLQAAGSSIPAIAPSPAGRRAARYSDDRSSCR
jgi:hypothetical protein